MIAPLLSSEASNFLVSVGQRIKRAPLIALLVVRSLVHPQVDVDHRPAMHRDAKARGNASSTVACQLESSRCPND